MRKFGFQKIVVVAALVAGSTIQSQAGPLDDLMGPDGAVFDRSYSVDFLKENPNQEVAGIRFEKFPKSDEKKSQPDDVPGMEFTVEIKFRDSNKAFEAAGMCFPSAEGQLDCRIDCDGSGFFVKADESGSILLLNSEGFELNGCSESKLKTRTLQSTPDYSVYRLKPAKQG